MVIEGSVSWEVAMSEGSGTDGEESRPSQQIIHERQLPRHNPQHHHHPGEGCGAGCLCADEHGSGDGHGYAADVAAAVIGGFAAPVRVVQNPSYNPAQLGGGGQEGVFYPAAVCPAAVSFSISPQPPLGFFQVEQPLQPIRPPGPEVAGPSNRPPAKRPIPREPSLEASSSAASSLASEERTGPRRGGKKALRMAGPPVRSHSTSELCLEERRGAAGGDSGERVEDAVFAADMDDTGTHGRHKPTRPPLRKSSRTSALTPSQLIDLTFQSDEEMSDDVSVLVPSDRATVGSSSVHGSEAQFGSDEVEVVQFDENSNQSTGDTVNGGLEVGATVPPPPYDFSERQQLHGAPIASPRLQGAAASHSHGGGPSPSQLHPHAFFCSAYPIQCPHATCSCHLRPRAPCSYWTGCPAAAIYCHHHHHMSPPRAPGGPGGQAPCPLHSPCPHSCPFEGPPPPVVQPPPIAPPTELQVASASLRQLQQAGLAPGGSVPVTASPPPLPSTLPDKPHSSPHSQPRPNRRPNNINPQAWCPSGRGTTSVPPRADSRQHPHQHPHQQQQQQQRGGQQHSRRQPAQHQIPWPTAQQLQMGAAAAAAPARALNLPPAQRSQLQAHMSALAAQREASNRWFDSRRQRHPAGTAPTPAPPLTYAAGPTASVVSVASILSAAAATIPGSVLAASPFPSEAQAAGFLQQAAEAAAAANYQRLHMAQRSGSPLVYTAGYPYPVPSSRRPAGAHHLPVYQHPTAAAAQQQTLRNAAAAAAGAGQINIVVSPTGPSLPAQAAAFTSLGAASNLMTASLPMQVDWNLFTMAPAGPGGPFLMQQVGAEAFPVAGVAGVAGTLSLAQAAAAEPQPVGASLDTIERCTRKALWVVQDVPEGEEERCTVCLSEFEANETIRTLNCEHLFHTGCIDRWLTYNKKCPVCRVDVDRKGASMAGSSRQTGSVPPLNAAS